MPRSRLLAATVAAALTLGLGACTGSDPKKPSSAPSQSQTPEPLSQDELQAALLEPGTLGGRFTTTLVPNTEFHTVFDDPSLDLGCLRALDELTYDVPVSRSVGFTFEAKNDAKSPSLVNLVGSADEAVAVHEAITQAVGLLRRCRRLQTAVRGMKVTASVTFNRKPSTARVDEQLNMQVVGSMRILRSRFPIGMWVSVLRIDQQVAIVSLLDLDKDNAKAQQQLARLSARRVQALTDGTNQPPVRRVKLETKLPN